MVSQAFRDMIAHILPTQSDQDSYFEFFQQPLKKSLSIVRHRAPNFEQNNPKFILSDTPFSKEFPDTMYVDRDDTSIALGKTRQHLTGQFYIQEVAAALPANILKSLFDQEKTQKETIKILDLCAAPGGKTAQLADYLLTHHITGIVRGNDIDAKRLSTWATNTQRCGLYNTVASKLDGSQIGNLYPEFFDAILVDAPCSGEGTGFKSDAAYKRRTQESINKIVGLQEHIVTSAIKACKVWGLVIYSTCTLNPFENEIQIKKLLEKYGDALEILPIDVEHKSPGIDISDKFWIISWEKTCNLTLNTSNFLRCRPHIHHTGWFFVCAMRKKHSTLKPLQIHITNKKTDIINSKKSKWTKTRVITTPYSYNKQTENTVKKILNEAFGIELDLKRYGIIEWKHKLNLTDASVRELVTWSVWFQECGIPILKPTGKTFSLEHEIALTLGHLATKNTITLTEDELQRYCLGEDIEMNHKEINNQDKDNLAVCNGYYILMYKWLWVGIGKVIDNVIKNKFFKW